MEQKEEWTGSEESEWSEENSVRRAMEKLRTMITIGPDSDEGEVEYVLGQLWRDGCGFGYNFG